MVQKLKALGNGWTVEFESSVVLDGTKTHTTLNLPPDRFESSVVLDGTKTLSVFRLSDFTFESSVVLDGTKTAKLFLRFGI